MPFSKHFCCTYVLQDLFTSHCGTEQQEVPRKHMVAIARAHCFPELSKEAPARGVLLVVIGGFHANIVKEFK